MAMTPPCAHSVVGDKPTLRQQTRGLCRGRAIGDQLLQLGPDRTGPDRAAVEAEPAPVVGRALDAFDRLGPTSDAYEVTSP